MGRRFFSLLVFWDDDERSRGATFFKRASGSAVWFRRCFGKWKKRANKLTSEQARQILEKAEEAK